MAKALDSVNGQLSELKDRILRDGPGPVRTQKRHAFEKPKTKHLDVDPHQDHHQYTRVKVPSSLVIVLS